EGLRDAVTSGLAHHAGLTGIGDPAALRRAIGSGAFETVQSYFNALNPSAGFAGVSGGGHDFEGLIDAASAAGIGVIAIRVMAAGARSGGAERAATASPGGGALVAGGGFEQDIERARRLADLAAFLGMESTLELGPRFALAKPGVSTVLVGFSD